MQDTHVVRAHTDGRYWLEKQTSTPEDLVAAILDMCPEATVEVLDREALKVLGAQAHTVLGADAPVMPEPAPEVSPEAPAQGEAAA